MTTITIPLSHKDDFLAHGPGRGDWWAVFDKPDLEPGQVFQFRFLHDAKYREYLTCTCKDLRRLTNEESAAVGALLPGGWRIGYETIPNPEDPEDRGDGLDPMEQGRRIRAEEEKLRQIT